MVTICHLPVTRMFRASTLSCSPHSMPTKLEKTVAGIFCESLRCPAKSDSPRAVPWVARPAGMHPTPPSLRVIFFIVQEQNVEIRVLLDANVSCYPTCHSSPLYFEIDVYVLRAFRNREFSTHLVLTVKTICRRRDTHPCNPCSDLVCHPYKIVTRKLPNLNLATRIECTSYSGSAHFRVPRVGLTTMIMLNLYGPSVKGGIPCVSVLRLGYLFILLTSI